MDPAAADFPKIGGVFLPAGRHLKEGSKRERYGGFRERISKLDQQMSPAVVPGNPGEGRARLDGFLQGKERPPSTLN